MQQDELKRALSGLSRGSRWARELLRAGIAGAAIGVVHASLLARAGLFAESSAVVTIVGIARYSAWFSLAGLGFAIFARLAPWKICIRRTLSSAYLMVWAGFLFKQSFGRGLGGAVEGAVVTLVALALLISCLKWRGPAGDGSGSWPAVAFLFVAALAGATALRAPVGDPPPLDEADREAWALEPMRPRAMEFMDPGAWNVLFLSFDTTRADHLGAWGYDRRTSPVLDSLAAAGVRFSNAIVQRPKTSPNIATLLTGTYPASHGIHRPMRALPTSSLTLAEILADAGWRTGAVVTNGNLYPEFDFDQGFQDYLYGHKDARSGADKAIDWLDANAGAQPWLLWVHATDPHWPYDPPEPWREEFRREGAGPVEDAIDRYDAEIAFADHQTGRILGWLHAHPAVAARTLVVFTADHGESLGEHDYSFEHGMLPYEASVRVPMLMSFPGRIPAGKVREAVVGSVDLLPTILDVLRVPVPEPVQGHSLLPLAMGLDNRGPRDFVFLEAGYGEHIGPGRTQALRTESTKYVHRMKRWAIVPGVVDLLWTFDSALEGGLAPDEFYDLVADPGEVVNLERAGRGRALRDRLRGFHRQLGAEVLGRAAAEPGALDPETEASLRSLGYIE